jgi:hypothetical protein
MRQGTKLIGIKKTQLLHSKDCKELIPCYDSNPMHFAKTERLI